MVGGLAQEEVLAGLPAVPPAPAARLQVKPTLKQGGQHLDDVVRYGMVLYGMVWYGMVWYGMVWYGMVWYGKVWYGMVGSAPAASSKY